MRCFRGAAKITLDRQSELKLQADRVNYVKCERIFTDYGVAELLIAAF